MCLRLIITALGAAVSVLAQCSGPTFTVNSATDAAAVARCDTVQGVLTISATCGDTIDLTGIKKITGDLIVQDHAKLFSFTSSTLNSIGGTFALHNVPSLSTLNFGSLQSIGSIAWSSLHALEAFTFAGDGATNITGDITISDTNLKALDPIKPTTAACVTITSNPQLGSFGSTLVNITGSLEINTNGQDMSLKFPDLTYIGGNVEIQGSYSDVEFPNLADVLGDFNISSTDNITESCLALQQLAPSSTCGQGQVHGAFSCLSNNQTSSPDYCTLGSGTTGYTSVRSSASNVSRADNNGLGTGAMAGIGVGVSAVGITLLLAGCFAFRRRQKKPNEHPDDGFSKPVLEVEPVHEPSHQPAQLKQTNTKEEHHEPSVTAVEAEDDDDDSDPTELFGLQEILKAGPVSKG